eukprot:4466372-Pyramimonas_sp.AAC.2
MDHTSSRNNIETLENNTVHPTNPNPPAVACAPGSWCLFGSSVRPSPSKFCTRVQQTGRLKTGSKRAWRFRNEFRLAAE